jgi:DNA polymerase III epsilon subunit-like protein
VHGITTEKATQQGMPFNSAVAALTDMMRSADYICIFNEQFDRNVMNNEHVLRYKSDSYLQRHTDKIRCIMLMMAAQMKMPGDYGDYKWPKLSEAYEWLYKESLSGAHGALADARATGWIAWSCTQSGMWDFSTLT